MRIDLDQNATTLLEPEVREAMGVAMAELPGNPSSLHAAGRRAREALENARESVASLIGAQASEVVFTSGGTEANNLAVTGTLARTAGRLLVSAIEHPSVLHCARRAGERGLRVREVLPNRAGLVSVEAFLEALEAGPTLVSLMLANNETGCLLPVGELGRAARREGLLVHTDAVQAVGKIPVKVRELDIDLLTISAHKIGGPKGVGALWARPGACPSPLFDGGGQEAGMRPGTENVVGIVGFGKAAEIAARRGPADAARLAGLRDKLEQAVSQRVAGATPIGARVARIPNTSCIAFERIEGITLVQRLDLMGLACSTGAACEARSGKISHVLSAMGLTEEFARGAVRFSLGFHITLQEIETAVEMITDAVEEIGV
jgi:cysteine desulfurase